MSHVTRARTLPASSQRITPAKFAHFVLKTANFDAVIDWYASLLPGSRVEPATLLEQALADELDHGRARLASGRRATVRAAALINGTASHAVEFDDIWRNAVYHPGAPVIAAALATAQVQGMTTYALHDTTRLP